MTTVLHLKQLHRGIAETIVSRESLGKSRDSLSVKHTRLKALGESNGGLINRIESIETKWHGRVPVNKQRGSKHKHHSFRHCESSDFVYYTPPRFFSIMYTLCTFDRVKHITSGSIVNFSGEIIILSNIKYSD